MISGQPRGRGFAILSPICMRKPLPDGADNYSRWPRKDLLPLRYRSLLTYDVQIATITVVRAADWRCLIMCPIPHKVFIERKIAVSHARYP
jgi:hypothetical protein